jgi:glycine dehydrogenase subunit 2
LTYILTLGKEGIPYSAKMAVLNANYLKKKLQDIYTTEKKRHCMHEFVLSLEKLKEETGVSAMDVAKSMIDYKMHPPTMYFPMIVHEALMFEPTETENKETLDSVADLLRKLYEMAYSDPAVLKSAPHSTVISRPDEVTAARKPIVRYKKP